MVDIEKFNTNKRVEGVFESNSFKFPYRLKKGVKKGLIVFFNGWDPYKEYDRKASYHRWKEFQGLGYSTLYISQPEIAGVRLSHSLFSLLRPLYKGRDGAIGLIKSVRNNLDLKNSELLFFGKCSGSNPAFVFSLMFFKSRLLMINPETNPVAHGPDLIKRATTLLGPLLSKDLDSTVNTANLLSKIGAYQTLPHTFIYQNMLDETYKNKHMKPLVKVFNSALENGCDGSLTVEYCSDQKGHHSDVDVYQLSTVIDFLFKKKYKKKSDDDFRKNRVIYVRQADLDAKISIELIGEDGSGISMNSSIHVLFDDGQVETFEIRLGSKAKSKIEIVSKARKVNEVRYVEPDVNSIMVKLFVVEELLGVKSLLN